MNFNAFPGSATVPASDGRSGHHFFEKCSSDFQTLKRMVDEDKWTIVYNEDMPAMNDTRPRAHAHGRGGQSPVSVETLLRLEHRQGKTTVWGCKICRTFFNYPSLVFTDLIKNHGIRPNPSKCDSYVLKLDISDSDLVKVLKNEPAGSPT